MEPTEKAHFDSLCQTDLRALKLRCFSESTIDVYARAVDGRDAVGRATQDAKADRRVSSPITTALYAQLTPTTDQVSLTIINRLMNTLTVDFKRR